MSDLSIRRISIAEQADRAAQRAAETGETQPNPHTPGTPEHRLWQCAFERQLQRHACPECEGSA